VAPASVQETAERREQALADSLQAAQAAKADQPQERAAVAVTPLVLQEAAGLLEPEAPHLS
jgi:hypothetical protein